MAVPLAPRRVWVLARGVEVGATAFVDVLQLFRNIVKSVSEARGIVDGVLVNGWWCTVKVSGAIGERTVGYR